MKPRDSRSKAMAKPSPRRWPQDKAFRRYPKEVPQRLAKAACSGGGKVLRYARMDSMNTILPFGNRESIPGGHLPRGNSDYAGGMEAKEIRRIRLRQLIKEYGTQTELAKKLDIEQNYISRALHGKKGIGEDFAAALERATGKPAGWMSRLEKPGADWPFEFDRSTWDHLPPDKRHQLEEAFRQMISGAAADVAAQKPKHKQAKKNSA